MSNRGARKPQRELSKEVPKTFHGPSAVDKMSDESVNQRMRLILGENSLTEQEKRYVLYRCSGMSSHASAKAAGYSPKTSQSLAKRPQVVNAIEKYEQAQLDSVEFSRERAHQLYMDAYSVSGNATEMKNVVDSLVKLHGVAADTGPGGGPGVQVNVQINNMENLTDEELLNVIGRTEDYLDPEAHSDDTE